MTCKAFDTVSLMHWKILEHFGCPPKFLTILHQLHGSQLGKMKYNGSLLGSFPISHSIKLVCVLAPRLFSIFSSIMLCEEKEDPPDGILIHF